LLSPRASRSSSSGRSNYFLVLAGCALQTVGLYARSAAIGKCPLTNWFEVLMFITWAITLAYLAGGAVLRESVIGLFTAPLLTLLSAVALFAPLDAPAASGAGRSNPWLELHITVSILSYGAFALAFATGAMYLVQERQLKTHHLGAFFHRLPSIGQLDQINFRFLVAGLVLLTVGLASGFASGWTFAQNDAPKLIWSLVVWLLYAGLLLGRATNKLPERKVALISVVAFVFVMLTFWGVSSISGLHRF
jgi:ABC-type uncharacterized transport system permease subunit